MLCRLLPVESEGRQDMKAEYQPTLDLVKIRCRELAYQILRKGEFLSLHPDNTSIQDCVSSQTRGDKVDYIADIIYKYETEISRLTSELEQVRLDNQSLVRQHNEIAVKLQVSEEALRIAYNEAFEYCREECEKHFDDVTYVIDAWKMQAKQGLGMKE